MRKLCVHIPVAPYGEIGLEAIAIQSIGVFHANGKDVMKPKQIKLTTGKILRRKFFIIFLMTVSAVLISFCFFRFCRVKTVTVRNNTEVDTATILETANIKINSHLFALNANKTESSVLNISPYIKTVQVKRNFPSEIVIEIEEYEADYCILVLEKYYLMTDTLLLLEEIPESEIGDHGTAFLNLPEINTDAKKFGIGKKIVFTEKAAGDYVSEALKTVSESFLSNSLYALSLHEEANIIARINENYTLRLGNKKDLADKLALCEEAVNYLKENMPGVTGTLYAWTTKQVTFELTPASPSQKSLNSDKN